MDRVLIIVMTFVLISAVAETIEPLANEIAAEIECIAPEALCVG